MAEDRFDRFMTDSDGIMWTIERDARLRSTIVVVLLLDRPPDWERLVASAEQATHDIPRLRQVVVDTPLRLGPPRWAVVNRFDVRDHLHRFGAPAPHDLGAVLELAGMFAEDAFDRSQPLWQFAIVDGLTGGRAACLMKVHHAITDGVGGLRLLSKFVDLTREAPPRPATPPPARDRVVPPLVAIDGAAHTVAQASRTMASAVASLARAPLHFAREPMAAVRSTFTTMHSIGRIVQPIDTTLSPCMTARSEHRRLAIAEYPMTDLRAAAAATNGTINDVFVAAVAGALDRYHRALGEPVAELRMTMPISTRGDDDPLGGNKLIPARFSVPVDIVDPRERVAAISSLCRKWRAEPALPMSDGIATVLDHLPAFVTTLVFGSMLKHIDFLTTNVPGSPVPIYLAGARVERFWAIAPPMGSAVNISLISHIDTACIGINMDPAAVQRTDVFLDCVRAAFDEMLHVGGAHAQPIMTSEVSA
jgi:diacylglycerol O-acyltransferase / wax synthase